MLFNSFPFALFFVAVWLVYRVIPRQHRNGLLLAASLLFYTLWIPSYLLLLLADIGINYALVRAMVRSNTPRLYLFLSVGFTLSLLMIFKYAALAVEIAAPFLPSSSELSVPELLLPLGISFYSFQIIALTVDAYRGRTAPPESLSRYALFISFFPQLLAGPILRGAEFLPQLERGGELTPARTQRGIWLIACGLFKKVVLADFLLSPFVESVFGAPGLGSIGFHVVAIWSFAFQIYFDFSGYSDMARGLALLLGFEMPFNFLEPYLSRNPAEFWQRWHITLSTWLRNYLFLSLGGGSHGTVRAAINLFLTMLLGGLWHGAGLTFAVWGVFQGMLLAGHRLLSSVLERIDPKTQLGQAIWQGLCVFTTFHLMCFGMIMFRAPSFESASLFYAGIFQGHELGVWPIVPLGIVLLCAALHIVERWLRPRVEAIQSAFAGSIAGGFGEGVALGVTIGIAIAASGVGGEFIYFQF